MFETENIVTDNDISMILQVDGNISLEKSFSESLCYENLPIETIITWKRASYLKSMSQPGPNKRNLTTIKRQNKVIEAVNLPTLITLNPRSLYNKTINFSTLVEQTEADVCFLSETWDRSHYKKKNCKIASKLR